MRYDKPIVMDLGVLERISGACVSCGDATSVGESCGTGTGAGYACNVGDSGDLNPLCAYGSDTGGNGDCLSGGTRRVVLL